MADEIKKFALTLQKYLKAGALERVEERGSCIWMKVRQGELINACEGSLENGAIFDSAFISSSAEGKNASRSASASRSANPFVAYYLFRVPSLGMMLVIMAQGKEFSALSANLNAAIWDERKIQDLTGLLLQGIPDSRPLIFHPESGMPDKHPVGGKPFIKPKSSDYIIKGTGMEGEFELGVGPVHAGIIEPGHFRVHIFGEQINKLELRMFYLHRGVEKAAEGKSLQEALPMIESISGDEAVANAVAYCHAVEHALGFKAPERSEFIRAILMELERIYSHLSDLGGMPTDVGFSVAASRFAVLREDMMRLNRQVSGSRFLHGMCVVGGVNNDLDKNKLLLINHSLENFTKELERVEQLTLKSSTYLDRVFSTGIVTSSVAKELALVGPVARAAGISCDLRKTLPYSAYPKVPFTESIEKNGDVLARFLVKLAEVKESAKLIKWLISHLPSGALQADLKVPTDEESGRIGVGWSEAPRGACSFLVELTEDGKIRRLACRTASFRNWRGIENLTRGNIVPDFPLINKSFNMSYAGTDL